MRELLNIAILLLKNNYRSSQSEKKGGRIVFYVAFAILYIFVELGIVNVIKNSTPAYVEYGLLPELITNCLSMGLSSVAILGFLPMLSILYFSSDAEFFLSLPVSQSKVYFSKLFVVYLAQLAYTVAIILPALITIGIVATLSPLFYIAMFFAMPLLPGFSILISAIICFPLMYIVKFFKNRDAASSIMTLVIFIAFFVVYMLGVGKSGDGDVTENAPIFIDSFRIAANYMPPLLALSRFATLTPIQGLGIVASMLVNLAIFIVPIVVLFAIAVLISRKAYLGAVAAQLEKHKKIRKSSIHQDSMPILKALMLREWKDIIRTPTFALQCFAGIIIAPIFLIIAFWGGVPILDAFAVLDPLESDVATELLYMSMGLLWLILLVMLQMFVVSINVGASTTISRDRESFFVTKLLPVSYKTQIKAKTTFYGAIYGACAFVCTIIEYIILGFEFWWMGLMQLAYFLIINYAFIRFCICMDLSKPKLDWKSYREIVKNSRNATVPAIVGIAWNMLSATTLIVSYIFYCNFLPAKVASVLSLGAITALATVFAIIMKTILNKNCKKYFDRIEC